MSTPVLRPETAQRLREQLPSLAQDAVAALISGVAEYAALGGPGRETIERAVQMGVGGFIRLAERGTGDSDTPQQPALAGAYELGRGEARDGRSMDALQAAYRIGGRIAWRAQSRILVEDGVPADQIAQFAELVFAYIDELSAASVAGHADERETTGRVRELYLERLGRLLLDGAPTDALADAADRAGWPPPRTLTAVLVDEDAVRPALAVLDAATLRLPGDLVELPGTAILLVPDAAGPRRARLLSTLDDHPVVVGPDRPWTAAGVSVSRAVRGRSMAAELPFDTEAHLPALITQADPEAWADLRRRALAPLEDVRPTARERLEQTLLSWLLHQGRRDAVAAELMVHPQTVRYRMTQLRELYGERLQDPTVVREIILALSGRSSAPPAPPSPGVRS